MDMKIEIIRTDYAPDIQNVWRVKVGDTHSNYHHTIDEALLEVRVLMTHIESDQESQRAAPVKQHRNQTAREEMGGRS